MVKRITQVTMMPSPYHDHLVGFAAHVGLIVANASSPAACASDSVANPSSLFIKMRLPNLRISQPN